MKTQHPSSTRIRTTPPRFSRHRPVLRTSLRALLTAAAGVAAVVPTVSGDTLARTFLENTSGGAGSSPEFPVLWHTPVWSLNGATANASWRNGARYDALISYAGIGATYVTLSGDAVDATSYDFNVSSGELVVQDGFLRGSAVSPVVFTKLGGGALVLDVVSSFLKETHLNAGGIWVGKSGALGGGPVIMQAGTVLGAVEGVRVALGNEVRLSGAVVFDVQAGGALTLSGALKGSGATVTKTGSGELLLSGSLAGFSGGLNVFEGALLLPGLVPSVGGAGGVPLAVSSGAVVGLDGDWSRWNTATFFEPGAGLRVGATAAPTSLRLGSLEVKAGGMVSFDLSRASADVSVNDRVIVNGNFVLDADTSHLEFNFSGLSGAATPELRSYELFRYSGTGSRVSDATLARLQGELANGLLGRERSTYTLARSEGAQTGAGALVLSVTGKPFALAWTGTASGVWAVSETRDWLLTAGSGTPERFYDADTVTFNDNDYVADTGATVSILGEVRPGSVVVAGSLDYTFTADTSGGGPREANRISGQTGLVKRGTGTLTILTRNDFTGAVNVSGGTLVVGDGTLTAKEVWLGGTGAITVQSGAELVYAIKGDFSVTQRFAGGGTVVKNGDGVMTIGVDAAGGAFSKMDINLEVNSGTLYVPCRPDGENLLSPSRTITINDGGLLLTEAQGALGGVDIDSTIRINSGGVWTFTPRSSGLIPGGHHVDPGKLILSGGTIGATGVNNTLVFSGIGPLRVEGNAVSTINCSVTIPSGQPSVIFDVETDSSLKINGMFSIQSSVNFRKTGGGQILFNGYISDMSLLSVEGGLLSFNTGSNTVKFGELHLSEGAQFVITGGVMQLNLASAVSYAGHISAPSGWADIVGNVELSSGLSIGGRDTVETLVIEGNLTTKAGSKLYFTFDNTGSSPAVDSLNVAGLDLDGAVQVVISSVDGSFRRGTYELVFSESSVAGTLANIQQDLADIILRPDTKGGVPGIARISVDTTDPRKVILNIPGDSHRQLWRGSTSDNKWNTALANVNWYDETITASSDFWNGDVAVFTSDNVPGGLSYEVEIDAVVQPSRVFVEGGIDYTFTTTGSGRISGRGGLTKSGAGTLRMGSGAHDFTGSVEILGGAIEVLTLSNTNSASALGSGANASKLVLNGGALRIANTAVFSTNRTFTIGENGGAIEFASTAANTLVTFNGTSTPIAHTGSGNRTLTLNVSGGTDYTTVTPTAGGVFNLQLTDPSGGKLKLVKEGAGFLTIPASNSHTGGTEIRGGCISIASDRAFGAVPTSFDPKNIVLANGGVIFNAVSPTATNGWSNGTVITLDANRGIYLEGGGGVIRNGWSMDFTVKGAISGLGSLLKSDSGLLILSGANTFSGGLTITGGNLALQNSEAIPHGLSKAGVVLSTGQMRFYNGVDAHINSLTGTGAVTNVTAGTTSTLYLGEIGQTFTFAGVIQNGAGIVALTKLGSGSLTLTANNTFTGDVYVEGGMLRGSTATALGNANNYYVSSEAVLDLRGVRIDSTLRTIHISGEGVLGIDSDETAISFSGLSGALSNSSMVSAASAARVVISGVSRIATFADFALTDITGAGDLTLSYLEVSDSTQLSHRKGFTISGTGARVVLSPDAGTNIGRLNIYARVAASMGSNTIVAPGGINIGQDGNLQLSGNNIIQTSGSVTLSTNGVLTLMDNSQQRLSGFGNPSRYTTGNASTLVTHNEASGTGVLTVALYAGESYFAGRIGSTLVKDSSDQLTPLPSTDSISLVIENGASGILTLANEKSDYIGATIIKGGVLNLEGRLSVSDTETYSVTGVLGNSSLTIDGGILRSNTVQLSSTTRTFTLGVNGATIESCGQGNLQFNGGTLEVLLAVPGVMNRLTLGGTNTGTNIFRLLLSGNIDLFKTGHGQWILGGVNDAANTYSGKTWIEDGMLTLGKNNALSASTTVTLGYNAGASGIGDTFGTLKLNGHSVTLRSLVTATNDADNRVINGRADTVPELTLAIPSGVTNLFRGSLGNGEVDAPEEDNALAVIKTGEGTFAFGGAGIAAYVGDTQIVAGTFRLEDSAVVLGLAGKNVFVGSPTPSSALFEVVGNTYDVDAGKTIVAGKSAAPSADLRGNFRLDGGSLFIGGEYNGGSRFDGTVLDSTGVLCTFTLDGNLSTRSGVTSYLNYTFGPDPDAPTGLTADLLHVTGTLTLGGNLEIIAMPTAYRLGTGTYDIIQYGTFVGNLSLLKFNADGRYNVTFHNDTARRFITMEVESALPDGNKLYWQGYPNTQWGDPTADTGANFYQAAAPGQRTSYGDGDWAVFGDYDRPSGGAQISAANRIITIGSAGVRLGIAEFIFDGADYVLNGPGSIGDSSFGGTGKIFKEGTGTLIINTANTYSGGTDLIAGRILAGNDQAFGTGTLTLKGGTLGATDGARTLANTVNVVFSSTIDVTGASPLTLSGALESASAAVTLTKTGSGALTLTGGGNAFTGTIAVESGSLVLAEQGHATSFHNAAFTLGSNTTLTAAFTGAGTIELGGLSGNGFVESNTAGLKTFRIGDRASGTAIAETFDGVIRDGAAGGIALEKTGVGTLILTGNNSYTGTTTVTSGVLQIGTAGKTGVIGSGAITIGATGTLRVNGNPNDAPIVLAQTITSTGIFEKATGNTVVLLNDNAAMSGSVNIVAGTLQVGDRTDGGGLGTAEIRNESVLRFNRNSGGVSSYTITNDISGNGDILKSDFGRLIYLGDNTSTGDTVVNFGTLQIGSGAAGLQVYDSTRIRLLNTALELNTGGTLALSGGVIGSGTVAKNGIGTVVITGTSTDGSVRYAINAGTLQIGNGGASGDLEGASHINLNSSTSRLYFNRSGTTTVFGRISSLSGGEFRVEGGSDGATGTVILTASNEIQGTVYVANHGILQIGNGGKTGALNATSTVTVNTDATSAFAFNRTGTNLHTGSNIVIEGAGKFIKLGSNEVIFNSIALNTGGLLAQEGRLVVTRANLPALGGLEASGSGVLELRNGTVPWANADDTAFDWSRLGGTGTLVLGADATVGAGTYSEYNYTATTGGNSIGRLDVGARTLLNLGDDPQTLLRTGDLYVQGDAQLVGQGILAGNLFNSAGGRIQPQGTSGGQITVNGNFTNAGEVYITVKRDPVSGALVYDSIHYTGSARFESGSRIFADISGLQDENIATGTELFFFVDDDTSSNPLGSSVIGGILSSNPALLGKAFAYNNGSGVSLLFAESLRQMPGIHLHDGLDDYVRYLDDILAHSAAETVTNPEPSQILGGLLGESNQSASINRSSGLGLASLTAMSITSAHDAMSTLRSHLESLRYERAINGSDINAAPYIVGTGLVSRSGGGNSDPVFNASTYGGLAGVDHEFDPGLVLGMNAGYSKGQADILDNGGKVRTSTARLSVYGTYMMMGDWAYVDAQAFVGYVAGDISRHATSIGGRAIAKTYGFDAGVSAYFGGILNLDDRIHLTPFAGFEFVHSRMDGFDESGAEAALRVDSFTQDSLRAKVGMGFNWVVPTDADFTLRVGFEAAYAYELMDSDAEITARFAGDNSGRKFTIQAAATPEHSIQAGPFVEIGLDENMSIRAAYSLEYAFGTQQVHHANATFRWRF